MWKELGEGYGIEISQYQDEETFSILCPVQMSLAPKIKVSDFMRFYFGLRQ
jgi:hypothetical protein